MELIAIGLRRELTCPSPATLDSRIASWQAFHRMRNLPSPFSAPLVQQVRQKARRANARPRVPKSPKPVTRGVLEALLASCDDSHRGIRDRAMLMLAFASGGRRRSEVTALNVEDIGLDQDHRRASVPPCLAVGPPPAPPPGPGRAAPDPAAPVGTRRAAGGLRHTARPACRVPDPSRFGRRSFGGRDEAIAAPLCRAGPEVLCRCRDQRKPRNRSAGGVKDGQTVNQ